MIGQPRAADTLSIVNVVTIGIVGTLLTWVSIIALQAYYKDTLDDVERARQVEGQSVALESVRAEQRAKLTKYEVRRSTTQGGDYVTLDIAQAKKLVVRELQEMPTAYVVPAVKHDPCACEFPGHNNPTIKTALTAGKQAAVEVVCPDEAKPAHCPGVKKKQPAPTDGAGGETPVDGATPDGDGAATPGGAQPPSLEGDANP